jgi:glycosyltransferase involved in cell wall biosynthesis
VKIALVHDWLTGMRGGEKCLEVLCRLFPDAQVYTLLHRRGTTSPAIERMSIHTSFLQRLPGARRHYRHLLPLMPTAVEGLTIPDDVDLVVSFSHAVAKSIRVPAGVPHVCYCFTPMRYAWHRRADYFVTSSRSIATPLSVVKGRILDWIQDWDQRTADRVTHFIAISGTIQRRIAESYGRDSQIIYPPVDTEFYTPIPEPTTREDFYLCVSALVPYKRIDLAVEACSELGKRLVVIGAGPEATRLTRLAGPTVELAGWCSNEEIRRRMRQCRALLFPGNEDFGIVPVEAQACGTPVIAYLEGGVTETILNASSSDIGTGWFFERQTSSALVEAIQRFEVERDQFCPRLARARSERFSIDRYERELIGFLRSVSELQESPRCNQAINFVMTGTFLTLVQWLGIP